ncbi:mechanosensitive ion channel domain-containing protein [Blastomonas sp.]|uniref:mechanosensitive ion channel family protein n=1 Tax=Blastomonas sp. TaxID=1909299 RepID=UPI0026038976|nr:mechanosensitive ion channel domain-containing protein [Blastomonas sp.]MDM7956085.1 mechanosensitive ion channel [Blastomonas sp.]
MEYSEIWTIARTPVVVAALVLAALLLHWLLVFVIARIARRTRTGQDEALLASVRRPLRWIMVALALLSADRLVADFRDEAAFVTGVVRIVMPLLWGWLVIAIIRFIHGYISARSDLSATDNLTARRRRTRADILARIATVVVILISLGLLLLKIPEVREIGVALVASAGIAGLAFGIAAQPLLKNLVAGIQLAFTEPVRIDDVVVYQGEWGRVEEITLTYVVLKIWDDRRLVIPVSKLLDDTIENWTRETSHLLGTVMLYLDHAADIDGIRSFAVEQVRKHPLWDKRVAMLQVTDMNRDVVELRVLMSGRNGSELFDMRCDVREAVLRHVATTSPGSLNRNRVQFEAAETA